MTNEGKPADWHAGFGDGYAGRPMDPYYRRRHGWDINYVAGHKAGATDVGLKQAKVPRAPSYQLLRRALAPCGK